MTIGKQHNHDSTDVYSCIKSCYALHIYKCQEQSAPDLFQHWEIGEILH